MKRTAQMKKAGVADPNKPSKFKGFRKPWREGEPPAVQGHLNQATAAFAARGSQGAIDVLGSKAKFHALAPAIKARLLLWMRRAKDFEGHA
jgi:hypothetical protein